MRVWDIDPKYLCYNHLNGQHHEIHVIYNIITKNLPGYSTHPEVVRWRGHLWALQKVHNATVTELKRRFPDYDHDTYMELVIDCPSYPTLWDTVPNQVKELVEQGCGCELYNFRWDDGKNTANQQS